MAEELIQTSKVEEILTAYLAECVFYYRHGFDKPSRRQAFLKAYGAIELAERLGLGTERAKHFFEYIAEKMPKH